MKISLIDQIKMMKQGQTIAILTPDFTYKFKLFSKKPTKFGGASFDYITIDEKKEV